MVDRWRVRPIAGDACALFDDALFRSDACARTNDVRELFDDDDPRVRSHLDVARAPADADAR